jgi:hypothetical protein
VLIGEKQIITNKCKLTFALLEQFPTKNYLPETRYLHDINNVQSGEVYIVRPCGRGFHSGIGIYIVTNNAELLDVKNIYSQAYIKKRQEQSAQQQQYFNVIISRYITDPLLYKSRKMHIRFYLMISLVNNYNWHLFEMGRIMTAKEHYKPVDFHNGEIHDTHIKSTDDNAFFPFDIQTTQTNIQYMQSQLDDMCEKIAKIYQHHAKIYPESKTGFEIFAIDTMFDTKYNLFMIEINDRVGYTPANNQRDAKYNLFGKKYQKWAYSNAIKPALDHYLNGTRTNIVT